LTPQLPLLLMGSATLSGSLSVLASTSLVGMRLTLMNYTTVSGGFTTVNVVSNNPCLKAQLDYQASLLVAAFSLVPTCADAAHARLGAITQGERVEDWRCRGRHFSGQTST
jgi:hypothetical protein